MAVFKKIFQSEPKSDYHDKIPDRLKPDHFYLHKTFQHGFPHQPTCLAYDPVQKLLAIGSLSGTVVILGKSGLERHFQHPLGVGVLQLIFLENTGHLVSSCNNNTLYLWSVREKNISLKHKLQWQKENVCHIYWPFNSDWLYVGMEGGNIFVVNIEELEISGYTMYWDKMVESGPRKMRPGDVLAMEEHPLDTSKILIAFTQGLCVLWNFKTKSVEKRFSYDGDKSLATLMAISWHGSGRRFAAGYSNGCIAEFNVKHEGKPDKVYNPHAGHSSPIGQLQWFHLESESLLIFSGGFPESDGLGIRSLTLYNSLKTHMLSFNEHIVQFKCLPNTPYVTDYQKEFAIVVLTKSQLLVYDLQTQSIPNFTLPFSFDIHTTPVTSLEYCGNCPDDFVAQLHSVKSKLPHQSASTKQWPIRGGKWGQESPDPWTDLIITGHLDGSVRLWFCRSVIMQPLFTISTSCYFNTSFIIHPGITPPPRNHTPGTSSPHSQSPRVSVVSAIKERRESSGSSPQRNDEVTTPTILTTPPDNTDENNLDSTEAKPILSGGGATHLDIGEERKVVQSTKRKSILGKAKKGALKRIKSKKHKITSSEGSPEISPSSSPVSSNKDLPEDGDIDDELDEEEVVVKEKSKNPPKFLPLKPKSPVPIGDSHKKTSTSSLDSRGSPRATPSEEYLAVSMVQRSHSNETEDIAIHQIKFDVYSQNLCVANVSGHTLVFDFSLMPCERKPQTLMIDMKNDSVILPNVIPEEGDEEEGVIPLSSFNNELEQQLPGFHVIQHCFCYYSNNELTQGVDVTALKYCATAGLLIIGSDRGLVIINTVLNQMMHVLGTVTSILYLADPNTYSSKVRKLTHELSSKNIKKVSSIPEFPKSCTTPLRCPSVPLFVPAMEATHVEPPPPTGKHKMSKLESVTLPDGHMITCLELVQMFINKSGIPTMTLWVGTYSGNIAVYTINVVHSSKGRSKTDILPSGLIIDMKSPVVDLIFLSEWGEQLITPYKSRMTSADKKSSPEIVAVLRRRQTAKELNDSQKPANYVVMVTNDSIKCIGFPGNHVISHVDHGIPNARVVHSGFFTCDSLPCLMSLTSTGVILVHTLPGLRLLSQFRYDPLVDPRALYTFRISGDGQAIHQTSPSEVQRLSVTKHDNLNLPDCFPDLYLPINTPAPASKGIISDIFSGLTTPTTTNRDAYFSAVVAGRAWKSLAKRDDSMTKSDGKIGDKKETRGGASNTKGGANDAMKRAQEGLDKRGKELSELERQTEQLTEDATDFASVAEQLAEKYRRKRFL